MHQHWVLVRLLFLNLSKISKTKYCISNNEDLEKLLKYGDNQDLDENVMSDINLECAMVFTVLKYINQGTATEHMIEQT